VRCGFPIRHRPALSFRARLDSVLAVVYLVFNEGYSASSSAALLRPDLSTEAIRLGRLLCELLPEPEVLGLLTLLLLQDSRRLARASPEGDLILLEDQNRSLWNQDQIAEGRALVARIFAEGQVGIYGIQAAIALVHALAPNPRPQTGPRLWPFTICWTRLIPRPSWRSIGPSPWPCGTAPALGWN